MGERSRALGAVETTVLVVVNDGLFGFRSDSLLAATI